MSIGGDLPITTKFGRAQFHVCQIFVGVFGISHFSFRFNIAPSEWDWYFAPAVGNLPFGNPPHPNIKKGGA
jgi:hypothetical protein